VSDAAFDKVVDNAKINWKEPVDNFNSLPSNAKNGDTRMDRSTGKVYRYDGTNWVEIQQIDAGPVNEVDARLTSQLNEKASSQYDSLTIKVPSDFSSVSEAITKMSEYQTKRNVVINILVESGHKPSSSIQLYGGDYSRFEISSEDDI